MATTRLVLLAGGAIAHVDHGRATVMRCSWLCQVPSDNPEPDCEGDRWRFVDCGATIRVHPQYPDGPLGDATICDAGHDRLPCSIDLAPYGPAWQREQEDRFEQTGQVVS